jgi:hypothetical protein
MFSLISKPVYIIKPEKIIIQFFYFLLKDKLNNKNNFNLIFKNKLKIICKFLTQILKKPIELELTKLNLPHYNADILVNLIGMFINKIKLRKIINKLKLKAITKKFKNNNNIPSAISGFKFKVAGRLLTQKSVPRKTVKLISSGSLARGKTLLVETARFTNKNKKGAFSVTVSIGHKPNNTNINPFFQN